MGEILENRRRRAVVVGGLVVLSTALTATTVFPKTNPTALCLALFAALAVALATAGTISARSSGQQPCVPPTTWDRHTWTTPPLETLPPPPRARSRSVALVVLRVQLLSATALLVAKLIHLAVSA